MNIRKNLIKVLAGGMLLLSCLTQNSYAGDNSLVDADWLANNINKKDMVILDVSTFTNYEKKHIPGAVKAFGPWQSMNDEFVGFMMPNRLVLQEMIRSYGVNNNSNIVIYDEGVTAADTAKSARALWTLQVLGHKNVAILDGGFAGWEFDEKDISRKYATPHRGNFIASYVKDKVADLRKIKEGIKAVVMVDCRISDEHFGHEKKSHIKRAGHLPNSRLWPAVYMTDAGVDLLPSYFKSHEVLAKMAKGVGIPGDKSTEIILYSNHGLNAALNYFVLHDLLDYTNVKIYDGSILEAAAADNISMEQNKWGYKRL